MNTNAPPKAEGYFSIEDVERLKEVDRAHAKQVVNFQEVKKCAEDLGLALHQATCSIAELERARRRFNDRLGLPAIATVEEQKATLSEIVSKAMAEGLQTITPEDEAWTDGPDQAEASEPVAHDPEAMDIFGCRLGPTPEGFYRNTGEAPTGPIEGAGDGLYPYVDVILAGYDRNPEIDVDASVVQWEADLKVLFWRPASLPLLNDVGPVEDAPADDECGGDDLTLKPDDVDAESPATALRDVLADDLFRKWPLPLSRKGFALNRQGKCPEGLQITDPIMVQYRDDTITQLLVMSVNWALSGADDDVVAWCSIETWEEQNPALPQTRPSSTSIG